MKPVKFRKWWLTENSFRYSDGRFHFYEFFEQDFSDEDKAEQFTGLQDKNGTDIYEGDLVKTCRMTVSPNGSINIDTNTYKVIWDALELKWGLDITVWNTASLSDYRVGIEVVGNIHQPPK